MSTLLHIRLPIYFLYTYTMPIYDFLSTHLLFSFSFRSILSGTDFSPPSEMARRKSSRDASDDEVDLNPSSRYGYGLLSTLYFHLLTGPLGGNVRLIGDAIAWMITIIGRRVREIVKWGRWPWRRKDRRRKRLTR